MNNIKQYVLGLIERDKKKQVRAPYWDREYQHYTGWCPVCEEELEEYFRYCPNCGQHLVWRQ